MKMGLQGDLIDEAIKAGKLTVCPPARAAGHERAKKKKGQRIRPCVRCKRPVKFIKGAWAAHKQRRKGWRQPIPPLSPVSWNRYL